MKKIVIQLIIVALGFLPLMTSAQTAIDGLYDKYAGKDGFTSINISPDMFEMLAGINMNDSSKDARQTQQAIKQLKGLKMLVYEAKDSTKVFDFYKEIKKSLPANRYKEIMTVNSDDKTVRFFAQQSKEGKIKEFLMIVNAPGESIIMDLTGSINMQTISQIGQAVNMPGMNDLKKLHNNDKKQN